MAGTAILGRLIWQTGTVVDAVAESPRVRTLSIDLPQWPGHRAGQHVDVRLTAEDGYQAVRSYSIASPPEDPTVRLTVERLDDGEVSPFLTDDVRVGDQLEFRGPIGGYFVWDVSQGGPLFLVAGGSGIVPLMAMIRHAVASGSGPPIRLLYSSRSPRDVIYRDELQRLNDVRDLDDMEGRVQVVHTYTREQPPGWSGYARRVDEAMLRETAWPPSNRPLVYVCGPTLFVEGAASALLRLGHEAAPVRTERFGPTGR